MDTNRDGTSLLKEIRRRSLQTKTNTSVYDVLNDTITMIYTYRQGEEENNAKHLRNFKSITRAVEYLGGTIFVDVALIIVKRMEDNTKGEHIKIDEEYKKIDRENMIGVALHKCANRKYNKLLTRLRDHHSSNFNVSPKIPHNAYALFENNNSGTYHNHQTYQDDRSGR